MTQTRVLITGDVIGVGFRAYIKNHAQSLNLSGWVKNIYSPQNAVEAVFQGRKENIDKMIELCKKGPEVSWVKKIEISWKNPLEEFKDFSINVVNPFKSEVM